VSLYCPSCRSHIPEGFPSCPTCQQADFLVCGHCGLYVPRGSAECPGCNNPKFYCPHCKDKFGGGLTGCPKCGTIGLGCLVCHQLVPARSVECPYCQLRSVEVEVVSRPSRAAQALATVPAATRMSAVPEVYQAGRHGVSAEVRMPPGDAAILTELGKLVELLHGMAGRLNQFVGMSEHTQQIKRGMRNLATEIQEEIELRIGPRGG